MGRQAYLTRGRSAFEPLTETVAAEDETQASRSSAENPEETTEPATNTIRQVDSGSYQQQYDRKGYPENSASRALTRQSRRAINDVLTTVGVCVGVDADGQIRPVYDGSIVALDKSKVTGIIRENEIGLLIGFTEAALDDLARMSTTGLRYRLQTFRFYSGIPLTAIINAEWTNLGFLKGLFAGGPADMAYVFLNAGRFFGMNMLIERVAGWLGIPFDSEFTREIRRSLLKNAGRLNQYQLDNPWASYPFQNLFNITASRSPSCVATFSASQSFRPVLFVITLASTQPSRSRRLCILPAISGIPGFNKYTRAALPAPDSPDIYSIQAAIEDEFDRDNIRGLGNAVDTPGLWESRSVTEELAKDLQYIGRNFQILYDKIRGLLPRKSRQSSTPPAMEPLSTQTPAPDLIDPLEEDASPPSPSYDPSSSSSASRPSTPRPQIEITGSTTSSGTVHMSVAIPVPIESLSRRPRYNGNPRDPPSPSAPGPNNVYGPYYRITTLTAQAAESMSQHLSSYITEILLLPLEALYMRSVALSFLSSPSANLGAKMVAERWKGEVYPMGGWFGMGLRGGWRGVGDYVGKMVLLEGLEMGIGFTVWQACMGLSWWVGRRWFEWGRL
ncbi:MAG: hypothetical protein ASARMPREDX12_004181 [Alectoria sarmentosa]|nr:MAG: hypothetical protein ASARMPREDX12_004181 [Alectoria sarmentosa]